MNSSVHLQPNDEFEAAVSLLAMKLSVTAIHASLLLNSRYLPHE
jgi:hypothetical protein